MDQTKPASDIHNQPADQKLINQHPELQDPSTKPWTPGPQPEPAPAPPSPDAASERPSVSQPPEQPVQGPSAPNDSQGHPRPHGPGWSGQEKAAVGEARRQEREGRKRR